ncbi:MAG: 16S rRNA (cytosine(1402)-N(4))-methyltransferase RsmH [Victivallales bacterium]|nr:16S rRNA (cytosine(1402)-N(4))-methyltransferase RsmH [Victivallales bacterium]
MTFRHTPVLLNETIASLKDAAGIRFVDGTLGGAGHASALLTARPDATLLGIDRDEEAVEAATATLAQFGGRATVRHGNYAEMRRLANELGWESVDGGILLDLGVSSHQLDEASRGFSFRFDAPLDMRMDRSSPLTAAKILNEYPEKQLADLLYEYGEERKSRQIARAVVERRSQRPWATTGEFAELLERIVGRAHQHGLPPATRSFQALRIAVNDELGALERGLQEAVQLAAPGARLAVITFHSLEDRIVKHFFQHEAATCVCPPGLPICTCGKIQTVRIVTRKPIRPADEECKANSRAACAKLRVAIKI